jgi:small-conductance mechanosensitive channel
MLLRLVLLIALLPTRPEAFLPSTAISTGRYKGLPDLQASPLGFPTVDTNVPLTELVVAGVLGTATDPFAELLFDKKDLTNSSATDFKTTFAYGAADSISNAARVYGILVLLEYVRDNTLPVFASIIPSSISFHDAAPKIALTVWVAFTLGTVKRTIFLQSVAGNKLKRVKLYDRLIDFIFFAVSAMVILDELSIDIGMGFQSIFAASGAGALIISLASRDLAEQIVGGISLQAWDAFDVGDDIRFGDGTEGTVKKIGLVETEIVGYDNIVIQLPNSQIVKQRISNISRMKQSQVKQVLRFSYADIDKVPQVLEDIKTEIQSSCPKLITDDSKPFAAVLASYEADHIQCLVNTHFNIQPFSQEYSDAKEEVLLSIARAAAKNDVKFAIPSIYQYVSSKSED